MTNPLLQDSALPDFDAIRIEHFEPAIDQILADNRALIQSLVDAQASTWDDLVYPIESADDRLNNAWSVVSHFNSVLNSEELRAIYKRLVAKITEYHTELGQNSRLFSAYERLLESDEFEALNATQKKAVENTVRDFRLAGVALDESSKEEYATLKQELSSLSNQFSENVLDATQGWTKWLENAESLSGVPDSALELFQSLAREHGKESGYLLTLDIPCYLPLMTYCENRDLRKEMYIAYTTRASDEGPNAGKWDNGDIIHRIMSRRQRLAGLLGFENYAERSLATKMAGSVEEVLNFLRQLADRSCAVAREEFEALEVFARTEGGPASLDMWDIAFYGERMRQREYAISQEELRPYFPVPVVLEGLFEVTRRLFGVEIEAQPEASTYHPDVQYFRVLRDGVETAGFYFDIYSRKDKRGGAWMADCRVRRIKPDGKRQNPVAFLTCNFTPPVDGEPSLLTHDEVTTLFHEFGHGLHHMLTQVDVADVSGINGVPWDVVELPSQFLENWCWQPDSIPLISKHYKTGQSLPEAMLEKMLRAKNFQSGMQMVRQIEFALFDFLLHRDYEEGKTDVLALLDEVRQEVSVKLPPAYSRFSHSFSHIFAGGYAAGYYSYKWAEVLSADAFSRFEEEGIFAEHVGSAFLEEILQVGGSRDAMEMFVSFRGRPPSVEPLLAHSGIVSETAAQVAP